MAVFKATIQIDSSPAVQALRSLAAEGDKDAAKIRESFQKALTAGLKTSDGAKAFNDIRSAAQATVNEQKAALAALSASGQGGTDAYAKLRAQLLESAKEAGRLDKALEDVNKEIAGANAQPLSIGDKITESLKGGLAGGLVGGIIGGGAAGLATEAIGFVKDTATAAFNEYKALNANIQNIGTLGVEAAGLNLQKFEGLINELSTRTPDTASNIANGVYNAISAGITGTEEEIVKFVETASKVAVAGLSDTNAAVNGLTSVVNAYGTGANGAQEASNIFFATIKSGKTTFNELNAGLANVIPSASAAGIKFDEVGASIAKLTTVGIPTAQATTQIRAAIIELQKPAKPLADVLAKVGLNAGNMGAQLKKPASEGGGLINTLQLIEGAAKKSGLSLTQVFGSAEAASAALSLTGKNAESALAIFKNVQADVADGVADKAFTSAAESLNVKFSILKNNVQAVFNSIFGAIIPVIEQVISVISNTVGPALAKLGSEIGGTFSRMWEVIGPILKVVGGLIVGTLVVSLQYAANAVRLMVKMFNSGFDTVKRAVKPLVDAISGLFGDTMSEGIDVVKLFQDALSTIGEVIEFTVDVFAGLYAIVQEALIIPFQIIVGIVAKVVTKFKEWFGATKQSNEEVKKGKGFLDTLREAFNNIRGTISGVTEAFREIKTVVGEFFSALADLDVKKALEAFTGFGERVKSAYDRGFNSVQALREEQARAAADAAARRKEEEEANDAAAKEAVDQLELAKKKFAAARAIAEEERKVELIKLKQKAIDDNLSDEQVKIATKKLELANAERILKEYEKAFKVIKDQSGFVASVGFKIKPEDLVALKSEFDDLRIRVLDLKADVSVGFNIKDLESSTSKAIKAVIDLFKERSGELSESLIDTATFEARVAEYTGSLEQLQKALEAKLELPEVQADPAALDAVREQIAVVRSNIINVQTQARKATEKVAEDSIKREIELNKRRIALLSQDEKANSSEIRKLLEDNLAFETGLKLRAIRVTGEAALEERRIILLEAERTAEEISKKYGETITKGQSLVLGVIDSIRGAFDAFTAEQEETRKKTLSVLQQEEQDLTASLKNREVSLSEFYSRQGAIKEKAAQADTSIVDAILGALKTSSFSAAGKAIAGFVEEQTAAFNSLASEGQVSFENLGLVMAGTFGTGLVSTLKAGGDALKGILQSLADAAINALDLLIPLISGQFIAFLGPFAVPLATVAVQGLKAAMNSAIGGIGADRGVVAIDHNYKVKPSVRDTIPVMMRRGESAIVPEATAHNKEILTWFNSTHGRWQDFALKNLSRRELTEALDLKSLGIIFSGADASKIDISAHPQVIVLEQNNIRLERELKAVRKEIRSLRANIHTQQQVDLRVNLDHARLLDEVKIQSRNRLRGQ